MKHTVAIGDWSDDGHGKHDDFIVEIPDDLTQAKLGENFRKNMDRIGFGPDSFCEEYEDGVIPAGKVKDLLAAGLDMSEFELEEDDDGSLGITVEDMLKIVMFYFGHGLAGFSYEVINENAPALIGYWSKVTADPAGPHSYGVSVGYGLYYS